MDDVLDPDIVRFTPRIGVSDPGPKHDEFPPIDPIDPFQVDMVDMERVEDRARFQVVLKDPEEVPVDQELSGQLRQHAPQFFLRNIRRHVMDHHFPHVPWVTEVWRDADEMAFGSQEVLTYRPADLSPGDGARRMMQEEQAQNRAVLRELDWHDYHGRWKEGLTPESWYEQHGLLHKKSAGRFAKEERADEPLEVVSKPASSGFDAAQGSGEEPVEEPRQTSHDPRFDDLPDDIKKMLGLL